MNLRKRTLQEAQEAVLKNRSNDYGSPERNFDNIAKLWNIYLGAKQPGDKIQPHDIAVLMSLVKIARIMTSPSKLDHWVDLAGYAACGAECIVEGQGEEMEDV